MRRCNFCNFKCTRINKMAAHIKKHHPAEFKALGKERQSGIKEAIEKAVNRGR